MPKKVILSVTMNNGDIFEILATDNWMSYFTSCEYMEATKTDGGIVLLRFSNISSVEEK